MRECAMRNNKIERLENGMRKGARGNERVRKTENRKNIE